MPLRFKAASNSRQHLSKLDLGHCSPCCRRFATQQHSLCCEHFHSQAFSSGFLTINPLDRSDSMNAVTPVLVRQESRVGSAKRRIISPMMSNRALARMSKLEKSVIAENWSRSVTTWSRRPYTGQSKTRRCVGGPSSRKLTPILK
jgi:hypothetical protein